MGEAAALGALVRDVLFKVDSLPGPEELAEVKWAARRGGGVAANMAVAYSHAGGKATLVSSTGSDGDSRLLLESLASHGVDVSGVYRRPGGPLRLHIYEDEAQNRIFFLENKQVLRLSPQEAEPFLDANVVMTDLFLGHTALSALRRAKERGAKTLLVLPHGPRAMAAWNVTPAMIREAVATAQVLTTSAGVLASTPGWEELLKLPREAAVTLGPKGSIILTRSGALHIPAPPVHAVDTTGAGDTYTGYYARLRLALGWSPGDAALHASTAASLKCTRIGAWSSPRLAEVQALLEEWRPKPTPLSIEDALQAIREAMPQPTRQPH